MEQETTAPAAIDAARITGIEIASSYVDDFQKAYEFYHGLLGLEKLYDMGDNACYFKLNENAGLYLQGGNKPAGQGLDTVRASYILGVVSARALFDKLRAAGVQIFQKEPMHMGGEQYWFQFADPSGNILEALGAA